QVGTLARTLLGQQRIKARNQAFAGKIRMLDFDQIGPVKLRYLQMAFGSQFLNVAGMQSGDAPVAADQRRRGECFFRGAFVWLDTCILGEHNDGSTLLAVPSAMGVWACVTGSTASICDTQSRREPTEARSRGVISSTPSPGASIPDWPGPINVHFACATSSVQ